MPKEIACPTLSSISFWKPANSTIAASAAEPIA